MQDMLNDLTGIDPFKQNAYSDTRDWLEVIGRELVDADMTQSAEHGIDLTTGAQVYIKTYEGGDGFVRNLKGQMGRGKTLTHRQLRAALNVMRREYLGLPRTSQPQANAEEIPCYNCSETFKTWDDLMAHKSEAHGPGWRERQRAEERRLKEAAIPDLDLKGGDEEDVIRNTTAHKGLDLTNLPDGRYAVPNLSGTTKDAFTYIRVSRTKRTVVRDRRYRYGAVVTGNEVVLAGTIEVRRYVSDTQELVGQQKPGDLYRGENEEELEMVLMCPEAMAKVFGMQMGHCCICGKKLTDDESRAIGMGLECERKQGYFTDKKWIKRYEASCPVCDDREAHDELFHKPGARPTFKGFDYREGLSFYECSLGHRWQVSEKNVSTVTESKGWTPTGGAA